MMLTNRSAHADVRGLYFIPLLCCLLCLLQPAVVSAQSYTITDLGTLGGDLAHQAFGVNINGQVVGYSYLADNQTYHAFLWQNGKMTDLGTLPGSTSSIARAINNNGEIVGDTNSNQAFVYSNSAMHNLGTLGGSYSYAVCINNQGQIFGTSTLRGDQDSDVFIWQNGKMTALAASQALETPYGVNDQGTFVGIGSYGGYIYQNETTTLIAPFNAAGFTWALGVNNVDQVVGYSVSSFALNATAQAFLWQNGQMTGLGTAGYGSSVAYAINNNGQVVGDLYTSDPYSSPVSAFIWQNGVITDLNTLIPANSGWVLTGALGINDKGQIVGHGYYQRHYRPFLLTPNTAQSPVLITNVTASNLSLTGATVSWNTNVPTNSTVEYGYTDSYGQTASAPALVTNHSITLNLLPDRIYHYRVTSTTPTGQTATSADQTFVTADGPDFYMSYANLHKDASGRYLIDLTFTNQGGADIPQIEVYGATLGGATPLSPNLPIPKFGLTTNASHTVTVTFAGTAGASGTSVPLEVGTALYDAFGNLLGYVAFNYRGVLLP